MVLGVAFLPLRETSLLAVPPIGIGLVDQDRVEVSWPDTGDQVQLESSDDLGFWQLQPGAPALEDGQFRQPVPVEFGNRFFRLAEAELDPNAPVYDNPPDSNPQLFPGQTVEFTLSATDPAGLDVSYLAAALPLPEGAFLNMETGEFSWRPTLSQVGATSITFLAFNGQVSGRLPVTFTVQEPPLNGETSLSGILLDTTNAVGGGNQPVVGAVVSLLDTGVSVTTGADGRFVLNRIPGELQVLDIAVASAQPAPDGSRYAGFREAITIIERIPNDVSRPFYMPRLAMDSLKKVLPNFTTKVENRALGVSIVVPPHTAMMGDEEFEGELSISDVPEALAPAALPDNLGFGQLVTIQPVGVRFASPVPITFKNVDALPPGSETDIWSLDPDAGVFTVVGTGKVTDDGEFIETIKGGVIAADWHAPLPPGVESGDAPGSSGPSSPSTSGDGPSSGGPGSGDGGDGGPSDGGEGPPSDGTSDGDGGGGGGGGDPGCPGDSNSGASAPFGSRVLLADGAVVTSVSTPAYISGGRPRSVALAYHSLTACPRIIVPLEVTIPARSAVPPKVSFEGMLGGLRGSVPVFYDTSVLSESRDEVFAAGLAFDARGLETGFAPYTIRATSHFRRSSVSADITDRVVVVNRSQSSVGAGWGVLGDQRIVSADGDDSAQLLISGDGSYKLFRDAATFSPFTVASFGGARASNYSFADGSLFTQARESITEAFPNAAFRSVETLGQASDAELLVLSPYASATDGAPLTAGDQAALTAFVRGGGCALVFLDHDLSRASFAAATVSLLAPFDLSGTNTQDPGGRITPAAHPLGFGPFGQVDSLDMPFGGFELDTSNSLVEVIVPGGRPNSARLALLPEGALGQESGPVIFVADTQAFIDAANFGYASVPAHAALLLNAIDFCLRSQRDPSADVEYVGPSGEFSRLLKLSNGTFERRMPDGARYRFNSLGHLTQVRSRNGKAIAFARDGAGNLTRVTDAFGQQMQLNYSNGRLSQIIDPAGRRTGVQHNGAGDLVRVQLPDGAVMSYEYDANHLMTTEIDAEGGRTERVYDTFGRAQTSTLPDGLQRQVSSLQGLAADLGGSAGTEADPVPIKRPEDAIASYTNGAGERHLVEIAILGTAKRVTDSMGRERIIERNKDGKPVQLTLSSGRQFAMGHDRLGRRTSLTDSATGNTLTMEYAGVLNAPIVIDNGQGQQALFEYDAENRPLALTSFAGRRTAFDYVGTNPNPSSRTDPSGLVTMFDYDASGNVSQISMEDSLTRFSYTPAGFLNSLTDAEGRMFSFSYDSVGHLTQSTLSGGGTVGYTYDKKGLRTQVTPPSGTAHNFTYDERGRFKSFVSPLGDALRLSYDYTNGRPSRLTWGGGAEVTYAYKDGLLTNLTTAEGTSTISYDDTTGLINRFSAPDNDQLDYTYDAHGRLVLSEWSGVVNGSVARAYDSLGRVNSLTISNGIAMSIAYGADDLITSTGPMTVTRDAASGSITATTLGNCTDTWTYNAFGELITYVANVNGSPVYRLTLTRDRLGRVLTKEETIQGTTTLMEFVYGDAGRLVQEIRDGTTINYSYDANGNRLTRMEIGGATETGSYNAGDQLLSYGGVNYIYDGCGRLRGRGSDSFVYDALGGLQSANIGGQSLTYRHPAGGRRVSESANGVVQRQFLYQDSLTIAGDLDSSGEVRSVFGYATLRGAPDFLQRGGRTFRIFSDDLGSLRLVVDCESGAIAQVMRHDAFGRVLEDSAPRFQPFGFAGGLYDTDSGFLRFGARDYDPNTGRWTAPDPSLFEGSVFNLYTYASNDPINLIDRNGLAEDTAGARAEGGVDCGGATGSMASQCLSDEFEALAGDVASAAQEEIGARAMTMDSNIFFGGSGGSDWWLSGHEMTHTAQGSGSCSAGNSSSSAEMAARAVETMVLHRAITASP